MKKIIIYSAIAAFLINSSKAQATTPDSLTDINESTEQSSTRLSLWIPGIVMKMAAEIAGNHVDNEAAAAVDLIRKFGNTTICIREGKYYKDKTDKKMTRKINRMERHDYEQLLSVIAGDEHVNISIRENKRGKIKRMVILVDEKDKSYVFVKMNCRLKMEDVAKVCNQYTGI